GINDDQLLLRMSDESFESVLDTNLTGAFRTVKRVIKSMMRRKKGRIVLISSVVGLYGSPGQVNYAASKSGLIGIARALTRELGSRGITANVVAPGYIDTEMTQALPADLQDSYRKAIPAGRFADPVEVARAVAFIGSDDAAYISGAVIPVDGGLGMGHGPSPPLPRRKACPHRDVHFRPRQSPAASDAPRQGRERLRRSGPRAPPRRTG